MLIIIIIISICICIIATMVVGFSLLSASVAIFEERRHFSDEKIPARVQA